VSIEAEKVGLIEKKNAGRPTVYLGMVFFLISEAFLFGSLFWTYYYLRAKTVQWPPAGVTLDSNLAYVNTAILLSSSLVIWWAGRSIHRGRPGGLAAGLIATICLGIAFLGITGYEWSHETFRPWTHAYGSIFYTMTGFHALHVLAGVFLMLSLLARSLRGRFSAQKSLAVEVGSLYWHFVDFIWLIVFTTLCIVR
jgi:heme/copper-type cytochrome/quinol oxidase subunit 3